MTAVADLLRPVVDALAGPNPPIGIRCWDGSTLGASDAPATVVVHSPVALRRLLWEPNELGLGRAYVAGEIDLEGDVYEALRIRDHLAQPDEQLRVGFGWRGRLEAAKAARQLGMLGPPPPPPPEEARLRGRLHSKERDAAAVAHHYDVSNEFYRLVLGPTMTYSCAFFADAEWDLDAAQEAKYDLICRKLGLEPGMRLLDVGCGWGGMVLHAARHYGTHAVGVTLSSRQAEEARRRVHDAGLAGRVEIRLQDYRDIDDGPYDAISSIGMFEHVGVARLGDYFGRLANLVRERGRVLNHAISRLPGPAPIDPKSFIGRYVFPDGELQEVGSVVTAMQSHGLEVRDVESLREHYALTLRHWVRNLEANWEEAVAAAGRARARTWRLYMAGSALNFEANRTSIHQVLGVRTATDGTSGMPLVRTWARPPVAAPVTTPA